MLTKWCVSDMSHPKSPKGFLAIDIDGTALVQKIDKNPAYGLWNSQSNVRLALISYIQQAQKEGYDIIILTARPQQIEGALSAINVGTKPTQSIVDDLKEYGVVVKEIERAPSGLKGGKMQQILEQYPSGAIGMLFDDQLKQVNDVRQLSNVNLIAYDINSKKDLEDYANQVHLSPKNTFHPLKIVSRVLSSNEKLKSLQASCDQLDKQIYLHERNLAQNVIHELCIRSFEAEYRDYQPEIEWINITARHVQMFLDKLNAQQELTVEEVEQATREIFGTKKLDRVIPNSNCDLAVKQLLEENARNALITELSRQCDHFLEEIKNNINIIDESELHSLQINVVSALISDLKNPNKTQAIEQFANDFKSSKDLIQKYPSSGGFLESIRSLLAKTPLIGTLFQTEKEKIVDKMEGGITSAYKAMLMEAQAQSEHNAGLILEDEGNQNKGPT